MIKKPKTPKLPRNEEFMRAMQELRRSNATTPKPSGKKYKRHAKHRNKEV